MEIRANCSSLSVACFALANRSCSLNTSCFFLIRVLTCCDLEVSNRATLAHIDDRVFVLTVDKLLCVCGGAQEGG